MKQLKLLNTTEVETWTRGDPNSRWSQSLLTSSRDFETRGLVQLVLYRQPQFTRRKIRPFAGHLLRRGIDVRMHRQSNFNV